jgi:hypothetical protein
MCRSARNRCAVRTTTRCFSLVTLSSGSTGKIFPNGARSDFHECQRLAVVADEIDFALEATRSEIPGYEYVPLPAQIPAGVGLTANAGATSFQLFRILEKLPSSRRPRREAQRTARNTSLEKIGMVPAPVLQAFRAV